MNCKVLLILLAVAGAFFMMNSMNKQAQLSHPSSIEDKFNAWKQANGRKYGSPDENSFRLQVFQENLFYIEAINSQQNEYTLAATQFADLTNEEFASTYLGLIDQPQFDIYQEEFNQEVANDVDWRTAGAVTPVKDQGQCGSCWAFSTTGCLEGVSKIFDGGLQSFSEQQLVDCSGSYGNQGCNGGLMDNAFKYVRDHGIVTEAEYKYTAKDGTCKTDQGPFKVSGYTDVARGSVSGLQSAVTKQPTSIAVDANNWSFYSSGIFSNCGTSLDHGVLAVGFTSDYWIVKNSWGPSWGEQGYIRLKMGNTCGCINGASYANK